MAQKKLILFVCTGNICRSPMAEGLFREMVKGGGEFEVQSAGVGAGYGQRASEHSITALRELKIDISDHRSQPLTEKLAREADCIFVMTRSHFEAIVYHFPDAAEKTYLLREFEESKSRAALEIPDPIGMGYDAYYRCREAIRHALTSVHRFLTTPPASSTMTPSPTPPTPSQQTLSLAIGADHGGLELKTSIENALRQAGMKVTDFGTNSPASVDYPDFAQPVCQQVISGQADYGILICTTGIGMSIAANRHPHIRAALVANPETAAITRQHNDANVLCLGARGLDSATALKIVEAFLSTSFSGGRHEQRVEKLEHLGSATPALGAVEQADPAIFAAIVAEEKRQTENIELIASENFTSRAVMEAQGSCLTNKYAEGYPGRRWYGGCENVDVVEQLAIDRAKELFGAQFANVQPHSGSQANAAVYFSVLQPGDKVLGMNLAHGGHLTHGNPANFSGRFYQFCQYGVSPRDERIDYDELAEVAQREQPKMITAGASAYPRVIDFQKMSEIAKSVGAYLFVDMAHIAGLVAAGVHPSPMEFADFVTTTTHKSLRGPRGGMVLTNREELAKKINSQVFPGVQGGPLMHVIAAKAVCFLEALQPSFREYQQQVVQNARALAGALAHKGYRIVSGGTDNHLMLVDLRPNGLNGKVASDVLDHAGITVNKNGIPFDTEKITLGGGIRIGTPAATTRGMKEEEMMEIADFIDQALRHVGNDAELARVKAQVIALTARFPLPR